MQQNSANIALPQAAVPAGIRYLIGDAETLGQMPLLPAKDPFAEDMLDFLQEVSRLLMHDRQAKDHSDVLTFAFWIRKASTSRLKQRFARQNGCIRLGRGLVFHVAPSNVPVNYAYSLAAGLLTGNANVVRVPSRDFAQVEIIDRCLQAALQAPPYQKLAPYVCLIRYDHEREINDFLSACADVRVIWGGDATIAELRKSPLAPRAGEVTFADRFSLALIDSDAYLAHADAAAVARDFYNDTYFTDQNACTSPRLIVWTGHSKEAAKTRFWASLHAVVAEKYRFQPIQGVNKLTSGYLATVRLPGAVIAPHSDNLIVRVQIPSVTRALIDLQDNSGFFFEYDCDDFSDLKELCDDRRCQTVACLGGEELLKPLLLSGIKGIDRVVPIGKTMDFDLLWDGYDLHERLTRAVVVP